MPQYNKISEYLNAVCEQIRWKKAHDVISKEIEDHIIDQKNAFMVNGLDEEEATHRAIKEMGDPILVGAELDHTHRPKTEWSIIALTGIALLIGFAIRIFITYDADMPWMITKSIISTIIGIGCMTVVYFLDFTTIGKYPKTIFLGLIALTIGVIALVSPIVNGKYFYVQFLLLLFPTDFAGIIYSMRNKGYLGIMISGIFFVIPAFIGLACSNFSSVIIYSLACLILLTLAIITGWFNVRKLSAILLVYIPTFVASITTILTSPPYRLERLKVAINPSLDPMGAGYIGTIIMNIISNAKFFGPSESDLNPSIMLPAVNTDYLIANLIHRFGWISFIVIMIVILTFIIRSYRLCSRQKSVLGKLVSISVLITFTMQVITYIASNLGFQLISQQTLPLISYGGTATIMNMILIGIMLSVFKSGDLVNDKMMMSTWKRSKLFEISDGKIIINLNTK